MISRFVRASFALVVVAISVSLAACSGPSPDESSSQSESALVKCQSRLTELSCDSLEGPHGVRVLCTCVPLTGFYDVATATVGHDTCGTTPIAIPSALPATCTTGVMIDGDQPIWACPVGTPIPHTLGLVHAPANSGTQSICSFVDAGANGPANAPCEAVLGFRYSRSNCIGTAPSGWMFIMDTEWVWQRNDENGGCAGQCAYPKPPGLPGDDSNASDTGWTPG